MVFFDNWEMVLLRVLLYPLQLEYNITSTLWTFVFFQVRCRVAMEVDLPMEDRDGAPF